MSVDDDDDDGVYAVRLCESPLRRPLTLVKSYTIRYNYINVRSKADN